MSEAEMIRCTVMRGGTSKALFFLDNDLPADPELRKKVILAAFGSPDPRQIDGLGGATSSTSKVAIISVSSHGDADLDYDFGQVDINSPLVDKNMNCGNISAAVGPFAVNNSLVKADEPTTKVRIFNTNTKKRIIAHVPVFEGKAKTEGDFSIHGVPGSGAKITLEFEDPSGAVTGKLLPTGEPRQAIKIDGEKYTISVIDAANPFIFMKAEELGMTGTELPTEFNQRTDLLTKMEKIRGIIAEEIGLVEDAALASKKSPALPKIGFFNSSRPYLDANGKKIDAGDIDITGRLLSMGKMIDAYMGTGTICTIAAANITGTIINEFLTEKAGGKITHLRIGHPFGVISAKAKINEEDNTLKSGILERTARTLMEGCVYVPRRIFSK